MQQDAHSMAADTNGDSATRLLSARPLGVFFGWWTIIAIMVCGMVVYGAGLYSFTLLVVPLTQEFGWSAASTAGLVSVFWLSAPLSLLGGSLNERFGATKLICFGVVIEAICLAGVSISSELWQMYLLRGLMGVGKVLLAINIPIVAAQWFSRRFGLANATAFAGWHLGGMLIAPLTQWLIESIGWRHTCVALSGLILVFGLVPVLIALRVRTPAELGIGIDGDPLSFPSAADYRSAAELGELGAQGRFDFVRTTAFWIVAGATILTGIVYSGLLTNYALIAQRIGLSPALTAQSMSLIAGAAMFGALGGGWLVDKFGFKPVISLNTLLMFGGVALVTAIALQAPGGIAIPASVLFGLSLGGMDVITVAYMRQRFDGPAFPYAFGGIYFVILATLFLGPILVGSIIDNSASVLTPLLEMLALLPAALIAYLSLPRRKVETAA